VTQMNSLRDSDVHAPCNASAPYRPIECRLRIKMLVHSYFHVNCSRTIGPISIGPHMPARWCRITACICYTLVGVCYRQGFSGGVTAYNAVILLRVVQKLRYTS
jgi:hypothetical protein